ncbi:hypothetical protein [Kaistia sp. MMO-174]|uniref:hypothetical protein n=1 Tax=Kaistia sp. MMO-174 TaxID=3081256 RepID=UPI0030172387
MIALHILACLAGVLLLVLYFRSIVVVALLNSKAHDAIERTARRGAVAIVQRFIHPSADYADIQRRQAWIMPIFVLLAVVTWFLLVQIAFTGILWGLRIEPDLWRALSASGSALSTLGYLTPSTLAGEYLAVFQAAIGLAVVMLLFTFVPGYQAAVQTRERQVGWLYARTDDEATGDRYLDWLTTAKGDIDISKGWEDWEDWFRGMRETHTLSPILSYVPSIYRGTSWIASAASVLDAATAVVACLGKNAPDEARICRREGAKTMRLIAAALDTGEPSRPSAAKHQESERFDSLHAILAEAGLPVGDKAESFRSYVALRAEYAPFISHIAAATLTPMTLLDAAGLIGSRTAATAEPATVGAV